MWVFEHGFDNFPFAVLEHAIEAAVTPGVAGDAAHGASLVVRALADGRRVATEIGRYLEPLKENKK